MKNKKLQIIAAAMALLAALISIPVFADDGPSPSDNETKVFCYCTRGPFSSKCSAKHHGSLCASGDNIQCNQYDGNCR